MSLRNTIFDSEFGEAQGLDTSSPIVQVREGYVRSAMNVDLGEGGYDKRDGYASQLSTPYDTRDIVAGIEYKSGAGVVKTILFGTDGSGSGGNYGYIDSGAVVNISTGLSGTTRPNFVQFGTLLFFFNGVDSPQIYDGSATRQVGITTPATAPVFSAENGTGALTPLASYIVAYTYYNSVTGAESSPSSLSAAYTLTGANDAIVWTISAGSATTADLIRFYRTVGNGNTLFLDGTAAISATSYTSTVADAGLGRQIEFDNTRITILSSTAKFPTVADTRLFLKTDTNEIRFSKYGQEGPMPESFEAKSLVSTIGKGGHNDDIVGINRINQLPIVLKQNSIGRLDPFGIPDITSAVDNVGYNYKEISDIIGAVSHDAATQVFGELVFLAKDNVYATDGLRVRSIADSIQTTIQSLGFGSAQRPQLSAINDVENQRIYIQVFSSTGASNPSLVLVGDYQKYPNFRWTTYEPGTNTATHPGITAGCYFHSTNTTSGKLDVWFGNSVANGKVYKMNSGTSDDGLAIYMRLVTRPYFGQNPLLTKLFGKAELQAFGSGNNYNLTVCTIYDLTGAEEECTLHSLYANGALYDAITSLYDTSTYADEAVRTVEYYTHRKAKFMQLVIKQTEVSAPVSLYAWGVYASGFGPNTGPQKSTT